MACTEWVWDSRYDMDIIPADIITYGEEAQNLLDELQSRNEKMFKVTILLLNTAEAKKKLDNIVYQTAGIAQKYNNNIRRLQYLQEQGLMSSLPLGMNQTGIYRLLTTTSTAIFVPFTTQELFQSGEALYYGLNALSSNMIMVDSKKPGMLTVMASETEDIQTEEHGRPVDNVKSSEMEL